MKLSVIAPHALSLTKQKAATNAAKLIASRQQDGTSSTITWRPHETARFRVPASSVACIHDFYASNIACVLPSMYPDILKANLKLTPQHKPPALQHLQISTMLAGRLAAQHFSCKNPLTSCLPCMQFAAGCKHCTCSPSPQISFMA